MIPLLVSLRGYKEVQRILTLTQKPAEVVLIQSQQPEIKMENVQASTVHSNIIEACHRNFCGTGKAPPVDLKGVCSLLDEIGGELAMSKSAKRPNGNEVGGKVATKAELSRPKVNPRAPTNVLKQKPDVPSDKGSFDMFTSEGPEGQGGMASVIQSTRTKTSSPYAS